MSLNRLVVVPLALVLCGGIFFTLNQDREIIVESSISPANTRAENETNIGASPSSLLASQIKKSSEVLLAGAGEEVLNIEQVEELLEWQYKRGYPIYDEHGNEYTSGYENYNKETLEQLAQQGDSRAMVLLGQDKMLKDVDFEGAKKYFIDAAVNGNTLAFAELSNLNIGLRSSYLRSDNLERAAVHHEEAYIWLEVGLMRGDKALLFNKSTYNFSFDEETTAKLNERAAEYYGDLNDMRLDAGFDEFDNSYPPVMDIIYSQLAPE